MCLALILKQRCISRYNKLCVKIITFVFSAVNKYQVGIQLQVVNIETVFIIDFSEHLSFIKLLPDELLLTIIVLNNKHPQHLQLTYHFQWM